jgi:hypothetical protein
MTFGAIFLHFGMDKMYQRGIYKKNFTFPLAFSPNFVWRLWPGFPIDGHILAIKSEHGEQLKWVLAKCTKAKLG